MTLKLNDKEITNPVMKVVILVLLAIFLVLLSIVIIPFFGILLGLIVVAFCVLIPIFGSKRVMGKVAEHVTIQTDPNEGELHQVSANLLEFMTINKTYMLSSKRHNVEVFGTDDYNKVSFECGCMEYQEDDKAISVTFHKDARVFIPKGVKFVVATGTGDIKIDNIVDASVATGAGDVVVTNLRNQFKGTSGAGDFQISFWENAKSGFVKIATASGDAKINVPKDSSVNYKRSAIVGCTEATMQNSENGKFTVKMKSASGDLKIS